MCQIPLHGLLNPIHYAGIFAIHISVLRLLCIWAKIASCLPGSIVLLPPINIESSVHPASVSASYPHCPVHQLLILASPGPSIPEPGCVHVTQAA